MVTIHPFPVMGALWHCFTHINCGTESASSTSVTSHNWSRHPDILHSYSHVRTLPESSTTLKSHMTLIHMGGHHLGLRMVIGMQHALQVTLSGIFFKHHPCALLNPRTLEESAKVTPDPKNFDGKTTQIFLSISDQALRVSVKIRNHHFHSFSVFKWHFCFFWGGNSPFFRHTQDISTYQIQLSISSGNG